MQPLSHALDTLGIHAREVADVVLARQAILGMEAAPRPVDVHRIAVWRAPAADADMLAALDAAAAAFADGGAEVEAVDLEAIWAELLALHPVIMDIDVKLNLAVEDDRRELLSERLVEIIDHGHATGAAELRAARERIDELGLELAARLGGAMLLAPAALGQAPLGLDSTGSPDMNRPWHALGLPAITLPAGTGEDGMPLGIQFLSRRHADDDLLALAAWAEPLLPPVVRPW
jgi:Asp-tRNA(Asn)/Glu-tRNA(Gln) amidotransferase A subunit family amidase